MINGNTIAVVVPAYNEEEQISTVIESMPNFVDRIVIVNDFSKDKTHKVVKNYIENHDKSNVKIDYKLGKLKANKYNEADILLEKMELEEIKFYTPYEIIDQDVENERIILIDHKENGGVGAAIATGYKWCKDYGIDCTAVMAGDGQMDPNELYSICLPIINGEADYIKGNRLIHKSSWYVIPRIRFIGNSVLSIMTKLASGYWRISDTQTGYTAISLNALKSIKIYDIYKRYGMPNDLLVKLNMSYCTIKEVPIKPVYRIGEKSKMKICKVIPTISWLLLKSFFKRIWVKYFLTDFHPISLFYGFAFLLKLINIPFFISIFKNVIINPGTVPVGTYMAFILLFISSFQSFVFAMWMDIQDNERLYK